MSAIAVSGTLICLDQTCDRLPVVSTVTNLIDLFEKCAFTCCCKPNSIHSNRYFSYIHNKSILRSLVLLVPILGNILVGVYDKLQPQSKKVPNSYEKWNQQLNLSIQEFKRLVDAKNTSQIQIYNQWQYLKISFSIGKLNKGLQQHETQKKEFFNLIAEAEKIRKDSYHNYIRTLSKEKLLGQARWYYHMNFSKEESANIKKSIGNETLETLLPKLQARINQAKNSYDTIEMQEIVSASKKFLKKA